MATYTEVIFPSIDDQRPWPKLSCSQPGTLWLQSVDLDETDQEILTNGNLRITGDADVNGDLRITGNVDIEAQAQIAMLHVTGDAHAGGGLRVTGNADVNGDLQITGKVGISTEVQTTTLRVTAGASVGNLTVADGTELHGNTQIQGSLQVQGVIDALDIRRNGASLVSSQWNTVAGGITYAGGNVGIGTSTPSHRFHVLAQDAVGLFESTGSQAYLRFSTNEGLQNRVEITNRPGGRLSLWTAGAGDAFNITRLGNVGVGTTNPTQKLDVNGNMRAWRYYDDDTNFYVDANTTSFFNVVQASIYYDRDNTNFYVNPGGHSKLETFAANRGWFSTSGNANAIHAVSNGYPTFWGQNGDGNTINVRNNAASYPCIWAHNAHNDGWDFYAAGNKHYGKASSIKLKRDVHSIKDALAKILQLEGVRFTWKESGVKDIGFIAEEVGKQIPEAVTYQEDGYAGAMSYDHVIPVLVEAMKEQQQIIQRLVDQVHALQAL